MQLNNQNSIDVHDETFIVGYWDEAIVLTGLKTSVDYPQALRRVKYHDTDTGKTFNYLTNNFTISAQTVADLYKQRWQVELFF